MTTTLALPTMAGSGIEADPDPDINLALRARDDPSAFTPLYRRHYTLIVGYLFRRLGDAHVAEDLAADTFIAALDGLHRYKPTGAPFRSWLLGIATRLANNHVRTAARRRQRRLPAIDRWHHDHADGLADRELARRAMLALSPNHQAVLCLHHVEGLSVQETAVVLGCRAGTVKSRLSRAREALRQGLKEQGHD